jgi:two-component system cell cycle response regulator DivK
VHPIIAVMSIALSGKNKKARAAGCDDYVPKPFSPRQLLAKIRRYR